MVYIYIDIYNRNDFNNLTSNQYSLSIKKINGIPIFSSLYEWKEKYFFYKKTVEIFSELLYNSPIRRLITEFLKFPQTFAEMFHFDF